MVDMRPTPPANRAPRGVTSTRIITPQNDSKADDLQFAKNLGFQPTEFVDLPGLDTTVELPPVVKPPAIPTPKSKQKPNSDTPSDEDVKEILKNFPKPNKVLTNVSEAIMPATFYIKREGEFTYHEESDDSDAAGMRLDNVSGVLPYLGSPEFRCGIYVKEPTIKDAAAISQAINGQSMSALFDALSKLVNVPYRRLTHADHLQIMYYLLINSYPAQRIPVTWDSALYGVESKNQAFKFNITEHLFSMNADDWRKFQAKGFTLPRVYDIENVETVSKVEDGLYMLDIAQFLDPYHPLIQPYVRKAAENKSTSPRLQGRIDFLAEKPARFKYEVEEFKSAIGDFGVTESLPLTADVSKITIGEALDYLSGLNTHSKEQAAEYDRLQNMAKLTPDDDAKYARYSELNNADGELTQEQQEELKTLADNLPNPLTKSFTPVEEGVSLVRDLWRFFPFL